MNSPNPCPFCGSSDVTVLAPEAAVANQLQDGLLQVRISRSREGITRARRRVVEQRDARDAAGGGLMPRWKVTFVVEVAAESAEDAKLTAIELLPGDFFSGTHAPSVTAEEIVVAKENSEA